MGWDLTANCSLGNQTPDQWGALWTGLLPGTPAPHFGVRIPVCRTKKIIPCTLKPVEGMGRVVDLGQGHQGNLNWNAFVVWSTQNLDGGCGHKKLHAKVKWTSSLGNQIYADSHRIWVFRHHLRTGYDKQCCKMVVRKRKAGAWEWLSTANSGGLRHMNFSVFLINRLV